MSPIKGFLTSWKRTWGRLVKYLTFSVFKVNFLVKKPTQSSWKLFLYVSKYLIRRTYLIKITCNFFQVQKNLCSKTVPYFDGSASSCLTIYIKKSFEEVNWGAKTYWILPASYEIPQPSQRYHVGMYIFFIHLCQI